MRHGKAEGYNAEGDHGRVLSDRGVRESGIAGKWLADQKLTPDYVLSSDAARAQQTARIASAASGYTGDVNLVSAIYEANVEGLMAIVNGLPVNATCVLIVGHNPGFEDLAHLLGGDLMKFGSLPTASVTALGFEANAWSDVGRSPGSLLGFFTAR